MNKELFTELLAAKDRDGLTTGLEALSETELTDFIAALDDETHRDLCRTLPAEDTARLLVRVLGAEKERVLDALDDETREDVLGELDGGERRALMAALGPDRARAIATPEDIIEAVERRDFAFLKPILAGYNAIDLAEIAEDLRGDDLALVFRILPKELAAQTFVEMSAEAKEDLIRRLNDRELKAVMDELFIDDAVDLVEEMPANVVKRIIAQSDTQTRAYINELLKYPKDSAGSIMTIEFVSLTAPMTVQAAFERVRETGVDKETIYTMYVTDESKKLIGTVSAKELLLASPDKKIGDIMERNVIFVDTLTDKEVVARTISDYGLLAIPVVDGEHRLVGIVTVDDAIDVIEQENTEDVSAMAGIVPSGKPYLKTGVFSIWKSRVPWLLILMVSATFTGIIISHNEQVLNMPIYGILLTACIPMLMDTGGNAGSQASVTIIRGITLGEVNFRDIGRVVWKELRVSLLLGATLAVACFAKLMAIDHLYSYPNGYVVAAVVCLTMLVTIVLAKLVGCTLPLLVKKCRLDPAVVASPFITTIVDVLALSVYCVIAIALLGSL